jgi:hypothetical protein
MSRKFSRIFLVEGGSAVSAYISQNLVLERLGTLILMATLLIRRRTYIYPIHLYFSNSLVFLQSTCISPIYLYFSNLLVFLQTGDILILQGSTCLLQWKSLQRKSNGGQTTVSPGWNFNFFPRTRELSRRGFSRSRVFEARVVEARVLEVQGFRGESCRGEGSRGPKLSRVLELERADF